ncbi:MAG TPA: lipopolysaccharide transport periplasmic protein LptA [Steroidobacteraceae bacterium]|jgi:lipopolysaccharide transport protein LptA|nr:lipopolysaccharide transport periplasmic protein LptA [Steroidobacteraceae bacterium]
MAAFTVSLALFALMSPAVPAGGAAARVTQLPILLDAQSTEVDLRTNTAVFNKVRITQGNMLISADQGHATQTTALDFDNNLWVFRGNVKISMDQGLLTADEAQITFVNKVLTRAVANGKPAEFQQVVAKTGKLAKGRAELVDYDVSSGVVRLSKDAYLSDGQNEIRGESLKYNVRAQSVAAEAAEQGSQRVHIIITPPPPKSASPKSTPPKSVPPAPPNP